MTVYKTVEIEGKRFIDTAAIDDAQAELKRLREAPPIVAHFPITPQVNLQLKGTHNDIQWQIQNWGREKYDFYASFEPKIRPSNSTWNYYLFVQEAQLSPEDWLSFWLEPTDYYERSSGAFMPTYNYYDLPWCQVVDWHGGVTFYEKHGGIDRQPRYVKIGCDFAHLWDEDHTFTFEDVQQECFETIRLLRETYRIKSRCSWSDAYDYPENGITVEGRWYTTAGHTAQQAAQKASKQ